MVLHKCVQLQALLKHQSCKLRQMVWILRGVFFWERSSSCHNCCHCVGEMRVKFQLFSTSQDLLLSVVYMPLNEQHIPCVWPDAKLNCSSITLTIQTFCNKYFVWSIITIYLHNVFIIPKSWIYNIFLLLFSIIIIKIFAVILNVLFVKESWKRI